MANFYQRLVHEIDNTVNPAAIEAHMRMTYGTLDHLSREEFTAEVKVAKRIETESPGYLVEVTESFGVGDDFDTWADHLNTTQDGE